MAGFLLWCILLVLCWPLALLALVLYPIRLVAYAAVSDCWHRRQRRIPAVERNSLFAGAVAARASHDLVGTSDLTG